MVKCGGGNVMFCNGIAKWGGITSCFVMVWFREVVCCFVTVWWHIVMSRRVKVK